MESTGVYWKPIYNLLDVKNITYRELGSDYFDKLHSEIKIDRLKRKLESLGYSVVKQDIPA